MVWESTVELDAALRAALVGHKHLVYQCVPAWWAARALFDHLPDVTGPSVHTILLVPDSATGNEAQGVLRSVTSLQPIVVARGMARSSRRLKSQTVGTLVATPPALLHLISHAIVKLDAVTRVGILWPERHETLHMGSALDTILTETSPAQRIIVTEDATALVEFLERHARRAPIQRVAALPPTPSGAARYVLAGPDRLIATLRDALDILNPDTAFLWDPVVGRDLGSGIDDPWLKTSDQLDGEPVELAIATELPSADVFAELAKQASEVLVILRPAELPYLHRIVAELRSVRLPSEADRAQERMTAFREGIRRRIAASVPDANLLALAPLFEEFDPALVAAAIAGEATKPSESDTHTDVPAWVRIKVNGGTRDRIRTGDLVGALLNAVGLAKRQVGRVEISDTFSLIEVDADTAQIARSGLDGIMVRGKTLAAQFDRR